MAEPLYQDCVLCNGTGRIVATAGSHRTADVCPICESRRVIPIGLNMAQVDRMRKDLQEVHRIASMMEGDTAKHLVELTKAYQTGT